MKMVKSKRFKGVYLRKQINGDTSVYFSYKNIKGNLTYQKVGMKSQGVTEQYAYSKRNESILLLKNGEVPHILGRSKTYKMTLNDIANFYFSNHKTKSTEKRQRQYNNRIKGVLGETCINNISSKDILQLQQVLENNGLGASTIIQYTELIGTFFNFYSKQTGTKLKNPTLNIYKPSVQNRRERVLSKDEIEKLLDDVSSDFTLSLFFSLALTTAARKSTIMNYKIKDINLKDKTITSYDFKNESTYKSFLDNRTVELLKLRIQECDNEPDALVIFKPDIKDLGRWISRESKIILDNLFNQGLEKYDRKNRVVIHTMRHTVLSHLGRQGSNIFLLQKISNHKSINMISRYTKLEENTGKKEIENLWN